MMTYSIDLSDGRKAEVRFTLGTIMRFEKESGLSYTDLLVGFNSSHMAALIWLGLQNKTAFPEIENAEGIAELIEAKDIHVVSKQVLSALIGHPIEDSQELNSEEGKSQENSIGIPQLNQPVDSNSILNPSGT